MALTSTQVLGAIVAPRAPLFTGPHRLTVQDCGARLAHSSGRLAHPSADRVIDSFPDPSAAPRPEIMIDRAPSWQIMRQQFPSTATANCVTNPIQDLTPSVFGGTPAMFGGGNQRLQAAPFGIGEITVVRSAAFHPDSVTGKSARAHLFKRALRETDKKLHGQDGYLVSELIRQLVQIRFGELTSEEAKGKTSDKKRLFNTAKFCTTENLLRFMAGTLRQGVSKLISLSPTLTEALLEIEGTIQKIHQISCVSWQDQGYAVSDRNGAVAGPAGLPNFRRLVFCSSGRNPVQPHGLLMALRAHVDSRTAAADTERAAFLRQVQPEAWKDPETFSEPESHRLRSSALRSILVSKLG